LVRVGNVTVGEGSVVKVMGIINASQESFYKRSVKVNSRDIASTAISMQEQGASIIDIGAMSTAPYLETVISEDKEIARMLDAIKAVLGSGCSLPISADTPRAAVAKEAISHGAAVINDVSGLKHDPEMAQIVSDTQVPVIIGAHSSLPTGSKDSVSSTVQDLRESISIAINAGVKKDKIILDPSIGFYRAEGKNPFFTKFSGKPWYARDLEVLSKLERIAKLGPVCISVSAKSFIGQLLGIPKADERIIPSISCEVYAATKGASIIRTHNVLASTQAQTMLQLLSF
jgi:dihydropteroate synthase